MDRKSKIWQIVLLVLLIAAIIAIILFNNKLTDSKKTLSNTLAQLSAEQENATTLQAEQFTDSCGVWGLRVAGRVVATAAKPTWFAWSLRTCPDLHGVNCESTLMCAIS